MMNYVTITKWNILETSVANLQFSVIELQRRYYRFGSSRWKLGCYLSDGTNFEILDSQQNEAEERHCKHTFDIESINI